MKKIVTICLLAFIATQNINAQKIYEFFTGAGGSYPARFIVLSGFAPNASVVGKSIQHRGTTSTSWVKVDLVGNADASGIYRIWLSLNTAGAPWTPELTNNVMAMTNSGNAQLALMNTTTTIADNTCPSGPTLLDLVGYRGTANPNGESLCSETSSAVAALSTSLKRRRKGAYPGQDTGNNFDDFELIAATTGGLPVEFTHFTAQYKNQQTNLEWATASEVNSAAFDVERSNDGVNFTTIGQVKAEGRAYNYTFTDENPLSGTNYYRLKQIDVDGKFDYSPIRMVQLGKTTTVALYPNPTSLGTTTNLSYASIAEETLNIAILDGLGRTISVQSVAVNKGDNIIPIETTDLSEGTYWVKISNETSVQTIPLMVK
jgi:hypothetical protein